MKITKSILQRIIQEELSLTLKEAFWPFGVRLGDIVEPAAQSVARSDPAYTADAAANIYDRNMQLLRTNLGKGYGRHRLGIGPEFAAPPLQQGDFIDLDGDGENDSATILRLALKHHLEDDDAAINTVPAYEADPLTAGGALLGDYLEETKHMKITKSILQRVIQEELQAVLQEENFTPADFGQEQMTHVAPVTQGSSTFVPVGIEDESTRTSYPVSKTPMSRIDRREPGSVDLKPSEEARRDFVTGSTIGVVGEALSFEQIVQEEYDMLMQEKEEKLVTPAKSPKKGFTKDKKVTVKGEFGGKKVVTLPGKKYDPGKFRDDVKIVHTGPKKPKYTPRVTVGGLVKRDIEDVYGKEDKKEKKKSNLKVSKKPTDKDTAALRKLKKQKEKNIDAKARKKK